MLMQFIAQVRTEFYANNCWNFYSRLQIWLFKGKKMHFNWQKKVNFCNKMALLKR